jgi:hypothetical protein
MEQKTTPSSNPEIDLGQLFRLIEKLFLRFFGLFGALFSWGKDLFLQVLNFFIQNLKTIGLFFIIFFAIGVGIDYSRPTLYYASMEVRPNMGSGRSLYKNIAYYNALTKQQDYEKLAEVFKISLLEASSLKSFEIEPIVKPETMITMYDNLFRGLDSLTAINLDFDAYEENFSPFNYSRHVIRVEGTNKKVFALLGDDMIKEIEDNEFYRKQQIAEFEVLDRNKKYYEESQKKVDNLRKIYLEALMIEAKKENAQGTSINMGTQSERETKELDLFGKENEINAGLSSIIRERVRNSEVVSVISEFEEIGSKVSSLKRKMSFLLGILGMVLGLMFSVFRLVKLNVQKA